MARADDLILERLKEHQPKTDQERELALKEITQELVLLSLSRSGFFTKAAFQGGTCLRIVHRVMRFSEDLDFILKEVDRAFDLSRELAVIREDLKAYGYEIQITDGKDADSTIKSAFLKDDSLTKILNVKNSGGQVSLLKIKVEVDSNPPTGSRFETKILSWPYAFSVTAQDLPSLFSGKLHALLCREYVKGRDVFDLTWYLGRKIQPNLEFLKNALKQKGPWQGQDIKLSNAWVMTELKKKISGMEMKKVKADIERFLRQSERHALAIMEKEPLTQMIRDYESNRNS